MRVIRPPLDASFPSILRPGAPVAYPISVTLPEFPAVIFGPEPDSSQIPLSRLPPLKAAELRLVPVNVIGPSDVLIFIPSQRSIPRISPETPLTPVSMTDPNVPFAITVALAP